MTRPSKRLQKSVERELRRIFSEWGLPMTKYGLTKFKMNRDDDTVFLKFTLKGTNKTLIADSVIFNSDTGEVYVYFLEFG